MKRNFTILLAFISAAIYLSCSALPESEIIRSSQGVNRGAAEQRVTNRATVTPDSSVSFQDHTRQIVGEALALIEKNEREGAPLDQRWYAFRRFGKSMVPALLLKAREVRFYGGREADVRAAIDSQYVSINPLKAEQDPGEIRLFQASREKGGFDIVIIGQNGWEVALKTVIRLLYLAKFLDDQDDLEEGRRLAVFLRRIRVFLSSITPRQEFIEFFHQHRISDPDAVLIGFQGDTRSVLKTSGICNPERYSSDSLRINWYPDANGKKVLLVSINGNRIFASRAGDLIEAMFEAFRSPPRNLAFFGSSGAVDAPDLVGQIVAPTVVVNSGYFNRDQSSGKLAHIIPNRAAAIVPVHTAHMSVESVVAETFEWVATNKRNRIMTVDQELYHIVNAVNTSSYGDKIQLYVALLVTDAVSAVPADAEATLQFAEDVIVQTTAIRREFLARVLGAIGITSNNSEKTSAEPQVNKRRACA